MRLQQQTAVRHEVACTWGTELSLEVKDSLTTCCHHHARFMYCQACPRQDFLLCLTIPIKPCGDCPSTVGKGRPLGAQEGSTEQTWDLPRELCRVHPNNSEQALRETHRFGGNTVTHGSRSLTGSLSAGSSRLEYP